MLTGSAEIEVRTRYGRQVRPPERYEPGTSETANQSFSSELDNQFSFHTSFVDPEVPKTVEEALSIPEWYQAMKDEFQSLEKNKVRELTKLAKNKNLVSGKWHFTLKRDRYGKIIKYKARYVARGFNQKRGVDFEDTYSPSVKMVSLRFLLSFAVQQDIFDEKPGIEIENDCFSLESRNNLFFLRARKFEVSNTAEDTLQLWQERLGHNNKIDIHKLSKQTESLKFLDGDDGCDVCNTQKARRCPICKTVGTRASKPLEIVHVDISPEPIQSVDGFKYALAFVDSFSRLGAVYLLKSKDEVARKLELFLAELRKPRKIVSDNPKEFKFGKFAEVCLRNHIRQAFTATYTLEENGRVERIWSTIGAMVRCMLKTANLKETFWSFAIRAAFHIKTRAFTPHWVRQHSRNSLENRQT